jgi:hypothetical protein
MQACVSWRKALVFKVAGGILLCVAALAHCRGNEDFIESWGTA